MGRPDRTNGTVFRGVGTAPLADGTSTASCRVGLGTGDRLDSQSLATVVGVAAPALDEMRLAVGGAVSTDLLAEPGSSPGATPSVRTSVAATGGNGLRRRDPTGNHGFSDADCRHVVEPRRAPHYHPG